LDVEKLLSSDLRFSKFTAADWSTPACEQCIYWEPNDSGLAPFEYGFCRRYAPPAVTIAKPAEYEARWPTTEASEWCGEYRPHPPQGEPEAITK